MESIPVLNLPKRYEILREEASKASLDPLEFVERVEGDARRVDTLLSSINATGCGSFEIFLGLSGSGKTTFVSALPKFFDQVTVFEFEKDRPINELPDFCITTAKGNRNHRIILISGRDNPKEDEVKQMTNVFDRLKDVFRTTEGCVLVLWPMTDDQMAEAISKEAWRVGRDSITEAGSKGLHKFQGLENKRFYDVADITCRNLTGDGLEIFGITRIIADSFLPRIETISEYYGAIERRARETSNQTLSILKERVRPKVWIVLPGDVLSALDATVTGLTQGTRSRVDVDLIGEFIDNPNNEANYIKEWRERRGSLAHLMRALDVRLFGLPPSIALSAARSFGDDITKNKLKKRSASKSSSIAAVQKSRIYRAILQELGRDAGVYSGSGAKSEETENEYRRLQADASSSDKALNKALGALLKAAFEADGLELEVISEKQKLPGSQLKPDIQIKLDENNYICLEPTWRSTDAGIDGEVPGGQNTLAVSHIKRYVLDKVTDYVRDMGL